MTIKLKVDVEQLTWEQLETLQSLSSGGASFAKVRGIVAAFMVDDAGQPVPREVANAALLALKRGEVIDVINRLAEAMSVPNASGGAS
jgi:hypothetical protein